MRGGAVLHPSMDAVIIFGGFGSGYRFDSCSLNDLWSLNISTNLWTWLSGNLTCNFFGVYDPRGNPTANIPAPRYGHTVTAHPRLNAVVLFGGSLSSCRFIFYCCLYLACFHSRVFK
jgi:hypothetical protein